jgi:hypothetical protein
VQCFIELLAVVNLVVSCGVVQMGIEDSCIVTCLLHELRAVEVPHEVVGLVDVLLRQIIKSLGDIPVLLIERRYLHSHFGDRVVYLLSVSCVVTSLMLAIELWGRKELGPALKSRRTSVIARNFRSHSLNILNTMDLVQTVRKEGSRYDKLLYTVLDKANMI